ncbi:MAG: polysaccharide pyruvyl transferase family protein [Saccharofermentans sp.]|nr:polysaccharide pyruvyl transferase family protein [Saccharofermentans sp.]
MRIGIITLWDSNDNYGQQLQVYALQQFYISQGHDPFLIRYDSHLDKKELHSSLQVRILKAFKPRLLKKFILQKYYKLKCIYETKRHPRKFEEFREKYILMGNKYSSYKELKNNPPLADMYVVGSDQVWNTFGRSVNEIEEAMRAYFLDFGEDTILRQSFAASWGRNHISKEEKDFIRPLISRFDRVSVREKTGIDICRECGVKNVELDKDPTRLIDAEKYRELYREVQIDIPTDKYVFLYYLNIGDKNDIDSYLREAKDKGLDAIYVGGNGNYDKHQKKYPTIQEWLCLIDNAEYVVTNSYHCAIISKLFDKECTIIKIKGNYSEMNSRFDSLYE